MYKHPLIIFEGIEGTGKSTQIKNVCKFLKKKKIQFIKIREPGGTKNSEKIRKLLLSNKSTFNKITDFFLIMASRSENIETIKKNYKKKIIIIDRFIYSTIAYQSIGMGINFKIVNTLNKFLLGNIKPSFIFLHTTNMKNLKKRLNKRINKNRYDKFNESFYKKIQKGFLNILKKKNNVMVIDTSNSISSNKQQIINQISKII
tara:strand:+ start:503 stop:1111 length:609 start_codon:yes stop_codon:yes gene_type:complete